MENASNARNELNSKKKEVQESSDSMTNLMTPISNNDINIQVRQALTPMPLFDYAKVQVWLKNIIPNNYHLGIALSSGDCFLHSVADGLNQRSGFEEFSIESLRLFCYEYVTNPENTWVKAENIKDHEDHNHYIVRLQFSAVQILVIEKTGLKLGTAVWGRPKIEGRMICQKFNVIIHVLQIEDTGVSHRYIVDQDGENNLLNPMIDYENPNIIHVVNYRLHFVPLINIQKYIPALQRGFIHISNHVTTHNNTPHFTSQVASVVAPHDSVTVDHLQIERIVTANIYTNSAKALLTVAPYLHQYGLMRTPPTPQPLLNANIINAGSVDIGQHITTDVMLDEKLPMHLTEHSKKVNTISKYYAGLLILATQSPVNMKELKQKLWNLPKRNTNFAGRNDFLEKLALHLQLPNNIESSINSSTIIVCHGLGGIGKTQIVIEYAYRKTAQFALVRWIPAENIELIQAAFLELANELGLTEDGQKPDAILKKIKEWIKLHPRCLLIFDNIPNYQIIENLVPEVNCDVIATSRYDRYPSGVGLPIKTFSNQDAKDYIKKILNERQIDSTDLCNKLAETMGWLPLALAQACALIKDEKISIDQYLDEYNTNKKRYLSEHNLPEGDEHIPVYITWEMTMREIEKQSKLARFLLGCCAYLHSDEIPQILLKQIAVNNHFNPDQEKFERAHTLLSMYSMLVIDENTRMSYIHRLVQTVMRERDSDGILLLKISTTFADYIEKNIDTDNAIDLQNVLLIIQHLTVLSDHLEQKQNVQPVDSAIDILYCYVKIKFYIAIMWKKCGFSEESDKLLKKIQTKLNSSKITKEEDLAKVSLVKARIYCRIALIEIIYSSTKMVDESDRYISILNSSQLSDSPEKKLAIAELYNSQAMYLLMRSNPNHGLIRQLCDLSENQLQSTRYNKAFIYKTRLLCEMDLKEFKKADEYNEIFFELIGKGLDKYSAIRYFIDRAKIHLALHELDIALEAILYAMHLAEKIPKRKSEAIVYCAIIYGLQNNFTKAKEIIEAIFAQAKANMVKGSFIETMVTEFERKMVTINDPKELFDLYINKIYQSYKWRNGEYYCDTKFFKFCLDKWQIDHPSSYLNFSHNWLIIKAASSALATGVLSFLVNNNSSSIPDVQRHVNAAPPSVSSETRTVKK